MNQLRRILPVFAILLSSCDWGKCIYEVRSLQASGEVIGPGTDLAGANITLSEQRDSDPSKDLYFIVNAPSLKGHVTSAELKDAADLSHVLLALPLASADRPVISESAVSTRADANLSGYWEIFSANRGVIELRTDTPGRALVTIPLTVMSKTNWTRPECS
jgi:hypothetical protein